MNHKNYIVHTIPYPIDEILEDMKRNDTLNPSPNQSCFSDFVFKIRLIRLGFSFKKLKIPVLYLKSQPTNSQSGVIPITPTEPTVSGGHRKAFSNLQPCMTDSS